MENFTLKIKRVVVLESTGTDIIMFYPELESAFPEMQYEPMMKMDVRKGYGKEYCEKVLKLDYEYIKV